MPDGMLKPVLLAGAMLCVMSAVDTLAYGVRTAGVVTRKLALSLSLFNILVINSRFANMLSAPVLGNFPDKVYQGQYTVPQVLLALRYDLLFVVAGVVIGALLMPTMIRLFRRGIQVLEDKGTLPRTMWHGARRLAMLPHYLARPTVGQLRAYADVRVLPYNFLVYNIFVTCFYSIGVMSTVLAASVDHSVAGTAILLSGSVNVIATLLLFVIVDPPGAVVVEQCISGKRPLSHAKVMNMALVATRLLGTLLALVLLPVMAQYVLVTAHWVDRAFAAGKSQVVGKASADANGLEYELSAMQTATGELKLDLRVHNPLDQPHGVSYSSGADFDFLLSQAGQELWRNSAGSRATQEMRQVQVPGHTTLHFSATVAAAEFAGSDADVPYQLEAVHLTLPPVAFKLDVSLSTASEVQP